MILNCEEWLLAIPFRDVNEDSEVLQRYAEVGLWYGTLLGEEPFDHLLDASPLATKGQECHHGFRISSTAQMRRDLPWIRASVPFWYTRLAMLFRLDHATLDPKQVAHLAARLAEADAATKALGLGSPHGQILSILAAELAALVAHDEKALHAQLHRVAEMRDKGLRDLAARWLGDSARFMDLEWYAKVLDIWRQELDYKPKYFWIAWRAALNKAPAQALMAARLASERFKEDPAFVEEYGFMRSLLARLRPWFQQSRRAVNADHDAPPSRNTLRALSAGCASCLGQRGFAASSSDISGALFGWIDPHIRPFDASASSGVDVEDRVRLSDGSGTFSRSVWHDGLRFQPWHDDHHEVQLYAAWNESLASTQAQLTPDGQFPSHLYDFRVGGSYREVTDSGIIYGGSALLGSADRQPFSSSAGTTISSTLFTRLPRTNGDAWLFTLSYSNDRAVLNNVPLPGVGYEWHPDPSVTALIGLPFLLVTWHPDARSDLDAATSILGYAHLGAWYKPLASVSALRVTAALDYSSEVYKWPGHIASDQFVYFRGIQASAGLRYEVSPLIGANAYAGYLCDRAVLIGTSILKYDEVLNLRPGFVYGMSLHVGF